MSLLQHWTVLGSGALFPHGLVGCGSQPACGWPGGGRRMQQNYRKREMEREMQHRLWARDWEVGRKCDLVWVFWTPCSICPLWQRGRVTGIGRNWISRLNTPPASSPLFPSSRHHHFSLLLSTYSPVSLTGEMWWRLQAEMFLPSVAKEPLSQARLIGRLNIQQ